MIAVKYAAPRLVLCLLLTGALSSCGSSDDQSGSTTVATIILTPETTVSIPVGQVEQYIAIGYDSSGNEVPVVTFTWSSSDFAVATVSNNGLAKALSDGTTTISASVLGLNGQQVSGSEKLIVTGSAVVQGVAALGMPLGNAAVGLKDDVGRQANATTASDGSFTLSTAGLTPPFLLQVQLPGGGMLYSASADSNPSTTINVNPLTDLAVRSWYRLQGGSVDDSFADPMSHPAPQPAAVRALAGMLTDLAAPWLTEAGLDAGQFSPVSTPFQADGTGFDRVLDELRVDTTTGQISLSDGIRSQSSVLSFDDAAHRIGVITQGTSSNGGTQSSSYVIP